jgi:hypothetical protein
MAESESALAQTRGGSAATEKLRKQMLGKRATTLKASAPGQTSSSPRPKASRRDSEDEEEGRSAVGKKRQKNRQAQVREGARTESGEGEKLADVEGTSSTMAGPVPAKKRGSSYLDEILARRESKKKKRRKSED